VLHLLLATDAGGLSRYVLQVGSALTARGQEVIVGGDVGVLQGAFDSAPFRTVTLPLKAGFLGFRRSVRAILAALGDRPIDLIHTHYRRATLLARRVQAALQARGLRRPPVLYTLHLSHISLRFPWSLFSDFGDHTHIASEDARAWCIVEAGVPQERITCLPHGVDTERFTPPTPEQRANARAELGLEADAVVGAYVGRLDVPKNDDWLIDLAATSAGQLPRLRVVLAGDGPHLPRLRHRIDAENLHERVRLLGLTDPLPLYRAADALLLPSAREGFSYVCAEAMACGVPAIRTRTTGTTELIEEGITGRSTPIDRQAFIAAATAFLAQGPTRLANMGRAARQRVAQRFTLDRQMAGTLDLYRRLATL
jgi:glycosyltransferase involved in cell wall biosynthesis